MWLKDCQRYDQLVWQCTREEKIKYVLLNDMHISVRMVSSFKHKDSVLLNGIKVKNYKISKPGDIIEINLPHEKSGYEAEERQVKILYEDEDLIAVSKDAGIVTHPTKNNLTGTLLNFMQSYFEKNKIYSKVRFINRLDRDTSGIVLVAKNAWAHHVMTEKNAMWHIKKVYVALVEGEFTEKCAVIDAPIGKVKAGDIRRYVTPEGQSALTRYEVLSQKNGLAYVLVRPETGRTHQIRCHMEYIGHVLSGDELYGGKTDLIDRQALHAISMSFVPPRKNEEITVKAELPYDILKITKIFDY